MRKGTLTVVNRNVLRLQMKLINWVLLVCSTMSASSSDKTENIFLKLKALSMEKFRG